MYRMIAGFGLVLLLAITGPVHADEQAAGDAEEGDSAAPAVEAQEAEAPDLSELDRETLQALAERLYRRVQALEHQLASIGNTEDEDGEREQADEAELGAQVAQLTRQVAALQNQVKGQQRRSSTVRPDSDEGKWVVLFRSSYPSHWNTAIPESESPFARPLSEAPKSMRYLRMRRMDTGEYVIIRLSHADLGQKVELDEGFVWNGTAREQRRTTRRGQLTVNRLLGMANREWEAPYHSDDPYVLPAEGSTRSGYRGWGFSKRPLVYSDQEWSWDGEGIERVTFEIAVTTGSLDPQEQSRVLGR